MPRPTFQSLRQRLLEAGIAPRFADRLHRELQDHYFDLEHEARCTGHSRKCARAEARERLGTDEAILREFVVRPELKFWVYRSRALYHVLHALCRCGLATRAMTLMLADHSPMLARFAIAGTLGSGLTIGLLLGMGAALETDEPARLRTVGRVEVMAPRESAGEAAQLLAATTESEAEARQSSIEAKALTADVTPYESVATEITIQEPIFSAQPFTNNRPVLANTAFVTDPTPSPEAPEIPAIVTAHSLLVFEPGRVTVADGELLPLVRVEPVFPAFAAARGMEGYVVVEYTVTSNGTVSDVIVIESSNRVFERPALEAAAKSKYKPRVVNGRAVPVHGVRIQVNFVLEA